MCQHEKQFSRVYFLVSLLFLFVSVYNITRWSIFSWHIHICLNSHHVKQIHVQFNNHSSKNQQINKYISGPQSCPISEDINSFNASTDCIDYERNMISSVIHMTENNWNMFGVEKCSVAMKLVVFFVPLAFLAPSILKIM